ncbi:MAG: N-6 DNA methylase [Burkholderiales bacterium]|nr:N-6 DNA methylase [Burkholderiales bacterium]
MSATAGAPQPIARLLQGLTHPAEDERVHALAWSGSGQALVLPPLPSEGYAVVTGAVPFSGSVEVRRLPAAVRAATRSRRSDLTAIAWVLCALAPGGRAALVVPESFLYAATQAHQALRRRLVEENALRGVVRLRPGLYQGRVHACVLVFAKGGRTDFVRFDGLHAAGAVTGVLARWDETSQSGAAAPEPGAGANSGVATREELARAQFDLRLERLDIAAASAQPSPQALLHDITALEVAILQGLRDLVGMLK